MNPTIHIKLANLYVFNVIQYIKRLSYGLPVEREPDERLMRLLENYAGIPESGAVKWRRKVYDDFENLRMDGVYVQLGKAFNWFLGDAEFGDYLDRYGRIIPQNHRIVLVDVAK